MSKRTGIKNYDISFKVAMCEEYLMALQANPNLTKREYAISKNVKVTTFQDWIRNYLSNSERPSDIITTSSNEIVAVPKFVEITDKAIANDDSVIKDNKVTLRYKDVSLEFDSNDIDKALEIIRRW